MAGRRIDPADFDHAVELHAAGKTIREASSLAGMKAATLANELRRRGIETGRRGTWRDLPTKEIADKYLRGETEFGLAVGYGVERQAIKLALESQGVKRRSVREASILHVSRMTLAERKAQTAAANVAATGRKATWDERAKRASTVERKPPAMSRHERQFAVWLTKRHATYRREVAVGIYNVDFAVGPVAVEILGGEWHSYKTARHASRTPYILNQGWAMVFVWATANHSMTAAVAEYVIAFADEVRRDPSLMGEYRVIRGDGHVIATGRADDGQFSGIAAARDSYYSEG